MTKEELITKALKDAYSYVKKQKQTEETGELLIILFKAEILVEKSDDIQNVSECMESECNSKRYWHFIYCEHHARRKKLI